MKYLVGFVFLYMCTTVSTIIEDKIHYYLSNHQVSYSIFTSTDPDKWFNSIDASCTTIFLIHGWLPLTFFYATQQLRGTAQNYVKVPPPEGCYNAIVVTWSASNSPNYFDATKAVIEVGNAIGDFALELHTRGLVPGRLDCTGASLGAHICGTAGRRIKLVKPFQVVTGLDPAGPSFTSELALQDLSAFKLFRGDGIFVSTIMTNGGFAGTSEYLGDVNFIANGGKTQPGCLTVPNCNHLRAIFLYEEAVLHNYFIGHSTDGQPAIFGRNMPLNVAPGIYNFNTYYRSPYGPST